MKRQVVGPLFKLYPEAMVVNFPCTLAGTWAPREVQATLNFGNQTVYVLAPMETVDKAKKTLQIHVIGEVGQSFLVSLPGEVENGTSTIKVSKRILNLQSS
jgi:hypothetical protein